MAKLQWKGSVTGERIPRDAGDPNKEKKNLPTPNQTSHAPKPPHSISRKREFTAQAKWMWRRLDRVASGPQTVNVESIVPSRSLDPRSDRWSDQSLFPAAPMQVDKPGFELG